MKLKPWGFYITLLKGRYFKVKLLYFKKGGEISLQKHKRRDELWCFIYGEGTFQNYIKHSKVSYEILKGHSHFVPENNWHHYKARKPTLVLEIQKGLCSEDDIERA
jgi:mannose-1-phosphate guanylyltransferase / mannose-6-phosphate isomerase